MLRRASSRILESCSVCLSADRLFSHIGASSSAETTSPRWARFLSQRPVSDERASENHAYISKQRENLEMTLPNHVSLLSGIPYGTTVEDVLDWLDDHGVVVNQKALYQFYMRAYKGTTVPACPTGQWFVLLDNEDEIRKMARKINGSAFGASTVRVEFVKTSDFTLVLFGKGAPYEVYGKGCVLEMQDNSGVHVEEIAALYKNYGLSYMEVWQSFAPLHSLEADVQMKQGLVHISRSLLVSFRSREEAHRALRDIPVVCMRSAMMRPRLVR